MSNKTGSLTASEPRDGANFQPPATTLHPCEMAEPAAAAPRILREILRTPAFREIIALNLTGDHRKTLRDALRVLLHEDVGQVDMCFGIVWFQL